MQRFTRVLTTEDLSVPSVEIELTHHQRRSARLRVTAKSGAEIGILVPRGRPLKAGDRLASEDGAVFARIVAAPEDLSVATTSEPLLLTRAAYHLGNRHIRLQIASGEVRYPHDHVLDDMCRELGLGVTFARAPFEPEAGGYSGGHGHGHADHEHADHGHHDHGHDHKRDHDAR